jgi:hypothetical protein
MLNSYKKQFDKFDLKCEVHIIVIYQLENYSSIYILKPAEIINLYTLKSLYVLL